MVFSEGSLKMVDEFPSLIRERQHVDAARTFLQLVKDGASLSSLVKVALEAAAPYLNKPYYGEGQAGFVNHGVLGLGASINLTKYLSSNQALLPATQAIWYLSFDCDLPKVDIEGHKPITEGSFKDRLDRFLDNIKEGNTAESYELFLSLKSNSPFRNLLKDKTFFAALTNLKGIGHKAIYILKTFELADFIGWEILQTGFYPAIAYISTGKQDYTFYDQITQELRDKNNEVNSSGTSPLNKEEIDQTIDFILNHDRSSTIKQITDLLKNGKSVTSIADTITLAAANLVFKTHVSDWIIPVHSFNYCNAVNYWLRNFENKDKHIAVYLEAMFVNQVSSSRKKVSYGDVEKASDVPEQELVQRISEEIEGSKVEETVSLTKSYLDLNNSYEELISSLVWATSKNTQTTSAIHDLKYCRASIEEYENSTIPQKNEILLALAKFLASSKKKRGCYNVYKEYFPDIR